MVRINDPERMNNYILKYKIDNIFSLDARALMELILFKKGEFICRESEDINYLYFFVQGKAKVYKTLSNGKSLLLCFYQGFKVLGDVELFNYKAASANVEVIEDTYCIGILMEKVREYLLNDAGFLRFICSSLGDKLDRCSKNSSINLLYPLENRLAGYILVAGEAILNDGKRQIEFAENLTEISELLGTSYRHLLRTLDILCAKGAIKRNRNHFEVADIKVLKDLSADLYY